MTKQSHINILDKLMVYYTAHDGWDVTSYQG